jgi:cyclopropane fatty-acyl-phospholipid synthase-like methyltransferase
VQTSERRGVIQTVSPEDEMWKGAPEIYFPLGEDAVQCIRLSMSMVHRPGFARVLDFGCGHGRVLRHLKAEFADSKLAACDIDHSAVDFCADQFGAEPIYGQHNPSKIQWPTRPHRFDLIWCGSVFTHLDSARWPVFLEALTSVLIPYGMLIFTTMGRDGAEKLRRGEFPGCWFPPEKLGDYDATGFAYAEYPNMPGYGQSLCELRWALQQLEPYPLRVALASEHAWGRT